jgi:hypothetical protein
MEPDRPPSQWPASKVAMWPLTKIKPYDRNPRTHPPEQIEALARDMREDGVTTAILVDENGVIIYGHGRRLAAIKNGYTQYPVMQALDWPEPQKKAVRLKDNFRGLMSGWDAELLKLEAIDLRMAGFEPSQLMPPDMSGFLLTLEGVNVEDPLSTEWGGMPAFTQGDKTAFRSIVVHFKDQESVDLFAKKIKQKITERTRFVWFPDIEIERTHDRVWKGKSDEPEVPDIRRVKGKARDAVNGKDARTTRSTLPDRSRGAGTRPLRRGNRPGKNPRPR